MKKILLLSLSAALLAGCAVCQPAGADNMRPGLVCKGCGSVWVAAASPQVKPGLFLMRKHHRCPCCERMAATYFSTGRLEGACPHCGKEMRVCMVQMKGAPGAPTP